MKAVQHNEKNVNESKLDKTGVINDPLGQTHSHASSEHCFLLFCFLDLKSGDRQTDGQHVRKTMIPTGRDFGLTEWIKNIWHNFTTIDNLAHVNL